MLVWDIRYWPHVSLSVSSPAAHAALPLLGPPPPEHVAVWKIELFIDRSWSGLLGLRGWGDLATDPGDRHRPGQSVHWVTSWYTGHWTWPPRWESLGPGPLGQGISSLLLLTHVLRCKTHWVIVNHFKYFKYIVLITTMATGVWCPASHQG